MSDPALYEILSLDQLATRVADALVSLDPSFTGPYRDTVTFIP
jgi:hypothetical protein